MPLRTIRPSALVFPASTKAAQSQSAGVGPAHGNQERPWLVLVIWPNLWMTGRLAIHLHSPNTGCCSRSCALRLAFFLAWDIAWAGGLFGSASASRGGRPPSPSLPRSFHSLAPSQHDPAVNDAVWLSRYSAW